MDRVELLVRRRLVRAFIEADPVSIAVTRKSAPVKTAAGGYVSGTPTTLLPQVARIVLNKRRYTDGLINSEAGEIPHTEYLLVAMPSKDFEVEDTFLWLGENYHITGKYIARTESILCAIDILGPNNRG